MLRRCGLNNGEDGPTATSGDAALSRIVKFEVGEFNGTVRSKHTDCELDALDEGFAGDTDRSVTIELDDNNLLVDDGRRR